MDKQKVLVAGFALVVLLIIFALFRGQTISKLGILEIFEVEFNTPSESSQVENTSAQIDNPSTPIQPNANPATEKWKAKISLDTYNSGFLRWPSCGLTCGTNLEGAWKGNDLHIGDSFFYNVIIGDNSWEQGFLSFNIETLPANAIIFEATINDLNCRIGGGAPFSDLGNLVVEAILYGSLDQAQKQAHSAGSGIPVNQFSFCPTMINVTDALQIQNQSGSQEFQVVLFFEGNTDDDRESDQVILENPYGIIMDVSYGVQQ